MRKRRSVQVALVVAAGGAGAAASLWTTEVRLDVAVVALVAAAFPSASAIVAAAAALITGGIANDVPAAVIGVSVAVAGGIVVSRRTRVDAPPSRFIIRLAALVILAIVGGLVEHLAESELDRSGNTLVDHVVPLAVGLALATTLAVLFSQRPARGATTTAAAAITLTGGLLLGTSAYWEGRDRELLDLSSAAIVGGLGSAIEEDLNQLTQKVNVEGTFAADTFAEALGGQFGNPSLSAAQLVEFADGTKGTVTASTSRIGFDLDQALSEWLDTVPDDFIGGSAAFPGVPTFLGVVALPDFDGATTYHVIVSVPTFSTEVPSSVVFALSVDELAASAIGPTLASEGRVEVEVAWRTASDLVGLWSTADGFEPGAISDGGIPDDVPGEVAVEAITLTVDGDLVSITRSTDQLSTPVSFRRLALAVEALLGILVTIAILLGADQSFRRERERVRREALLAAALEGSPGWTAVVDDDDRVVISNDDPFAVGVGTRVVDSPLFAADADIVRDLEQLLTDARAGTGGVLQYHHSNADDHSHAMRIFQIGVRPLPDPRLSFLQCVDVTEQRDRAMRSAQSERMEAIGVLAGSLAHDFNNLLFITLGYLQMLEQQPVVASDDTARTFVGRAVEAVERGAVVAKSLLSFARSQPLEASALDLSTYIGELRPLIEQAIGSAHRFVVDADGTDLDVVVDQGRLSSGLLNIVFNARDAIDGRGTITLRVTRGPATSPDGDEREMVSIAISDTGRGMSPDVAARAFEPFFTTKQVGSGTGLGLATVYSFAQQSGGWASIDSTEGVGTTVTVHLPPAAEAVEPHPTTTSGGWAVQRVLVIDDEPALADLVAAWLGDLGMTTRVATTPGEALRAVEEFAPQLVVSDANLRAEIDGLELARRIVEQHPETVIVFMTGFSDRIKALQAAGVAVLAKPFTRDDLVRVLTEHVGIRN